jgi:hypothetical protein
MTLRKHLGKLSPHFTLASLSSRSSTYSFANADISFHLVFSCFKTNLHGLVSLQEWRLLVLLFTSLPLTVCYDYMLTVVVFNTSHRLNPIYWLIPIGAGFFLLFYATVRMLLLRKFRPISWNPEITGLQMYPTRWSTGR